MMKLPWSRSSVVIACLLLAACGDETGESSTTNLSTGTSGTAGSSNTSAGGSGGTSVSSTGGSGTGGGALSFENDIWPILTMTRNPPLAGTNDSCSGANGCHLIGLGGLSLPDATTAYTNLIGMPSNSTLCARAPALTEVVPSEPDQSCFVVFYEQQLRDGLGWVDQAETDIVRAWVAQGAAP